MLIKNILVKAYLQTQQLFCSLAFSQVTNPQLHKAAGLILTYATKLIP